MVGVSAPDWLWARLQGQGYLSSPNTAKPRTGSYDAQVEYCINRDMNVSYQMANAVGNSKTCALCELDLML